MKKIFIWSNSTKKTEADIKEILPFNPLKRVIKAYTSSDVEIVKLFQTFLFEN